MSKAPRADEDETGRARRAYDRYARSPRTQRRWSATNPGNIAIRAELVDAAFALAGHELLAAREILDIGCGTGWWLERMEQDARIGATLHGLELLPERAAAARVRIPAAEIATGDARELPYADRRFDVVTLFTVLSSLSTRGDAQRALREATRVLAPGGALLVWEPRFPNPFNRNTISIPAQLMHSALKASELHSQTTTLLPPLARRLGARTPQLYPWLARIGPLCTHRLTSVRAAAASRPT